LWMQLIAMPVVLAAGMGACDPAPRRGTGRRKL